MGCPKYSQCDSGFTKLRSQLSKEELNLLL
ncbi:hypothetical protein ANCCAN_24214 [Ancylostoma caninum]|uniref:Uncharacterized protein n=1 Tax=Ancylostoma caninum TaxID=29170 RepID=A0A368FGM7_ANCCA|nr:hypothetical protein ANCCAN_24214 [Ancylostoma caninum]